MSIELRPVERDQSYQIVITNTSTKEVIFSEESDAFTIASGYVLGQTKDGEQEVDTKVFGMGNPEAQQELIKDLVNSFKEAYLKMKRYANTKSVEEIYSEGKKDLPSKK